MNRDISIPVLFGLLVVAAIIVATGIILGSCNEKAVSSKIEPVGVRYKPPYTTSPVIIPGKTTITIPGASHPATWYVTWKVRFEDGTIGTKEYKVSQGEFERARDKLQK